MKSATKIFILVLLLHAGTWLSPGKAMAGTSISFQLFYDDLSPYGYWVDNSNYGYVWVPNVSPGFSPYSTNGYWVFTNAGWTWVSNYSWGWAPFHYGRWFNDPVYGPMWVPGNEWGPGWVTWRSSPGYYGWAPIEPGISIELAYSRGYNVPYNQWTFVNDRYLGSSNINNYYVDRSTNTTIINNSTVINNIQSDNGSNARYNAGPSVTEVQQKTGSSITPVKLRESNTPGQKLTNGELRIYKPQVEKGKADGQKMAPAKVVALKEIPAPSERKGPSQPNKAQPSQQKSNEQPAKQPQPQQKSREQQPKPPQQKSQEQPAKQQQPQQKSQEPAKQQQQPPPKSKDQPVKQQPAQQKSNAQPAKQQPAPQKPKAQPVNPQPSQQMPQAQPAQQKPQDQKGKQQPAREKPKDQSGKEQQPNPSQNQGEEKKPH